MYEYHRTLLAPLKVAINAVNKEVATNQGAQGPLVYVVCVSNSSDRISLLDYLGGLFCVGAADFLVWSSQ